MNSFAICRYMLSVSVTAALFSGCGGSQPPIRASGAVTRAASVQRVRQGSSYPEPLIYASGEATAIYMLDYPSGAFVGQFGPGLTLIAGMCTDTAGDVYVVGDDGGDSTIMEFAHGGTSSIWKAQLYSYAAKSCAVDPTTGNLAVDVRYAGYDDEIAIYRQGSSSPSFYAIPNDQALPLYCTFDDSGDLFADAYSGKDNKWSIAELPEGGSVFRSLPLNKRVSLGVLQWVSSYLAAAGKDGHVVHLSISSSGADVIGETKDAGKAAPTWIEDSDVLIGAYGNKNRKLAFWNYPQGGKPVTIISRVNAGFKYIDSVLVSTVPSH